MVTIELLSPENFPVGALDAYERKQQVRKVYRKTETGYALVEHPYTKDWTNEQKRDVEGVLRGKRHWTYLALDNGQVVGFISLRQYRTIRQRYLRRILRNLLPAKISIYRQ